MKTRLARLTIVSGLAVIALGVPLAGTANARCAPGYEAVCLVATTYCTVMREVAPPGCAV